MPSTKVLDDLIADALGDVHVIDWAKLKADIVADIERQIGRPLTSGERTAVCNGRIDVTWVAMDSADFAEPDNDRRDGDTRFADFIDRIMIGSSDDRYGIGGNKRSDEERFPFVYSG